MKDFTFSNGITLPAGTDIAIVTRPTHMDEVSTSFIDLGHSSLSKLFSKRKFMKTQNNFMDLDSRKCQTKMVKALDTKLSPLIQI